MHDTERDRLTTTATRHQPLATAAHPDTPPTIPSADETLDALRLLDDDAIHPLAEKLTEKARLLIDTMVEHGLSSALAADRAGISRRSALNIISKPAVQAYLDARVDVARKGLRARSLAVVENALDAGAEKGAAAAHIRAGIEAARFLNGEENRAGTSVNVTVNVPGYVIDLTPAPQVIDITPEREVAG